MGEYRAQNSRPTRRDNALLQTFIWLTIFLTNDQKQRYMIRVLDDFSIDSRTRQHLVAYCLRLSAQLIAVTE